MWQGPLTLVGRIMLCAIFLLSAVGNKIPQFNKVAEYMAAKEIPQPKIMLVGAIAFLLGGSVSVVLGYKARAGALLLLIFLGLATYFFHAFWKLEGAAQQQEMIQAMKNLAIAGGLVMILANGPGGCSLDSLSKRVFTATA